MAGNSNDTIAAPATAPGRGAVGVIRVSGPKTAQIAQKILGKIPPSRRAVFLPFRGTDGAILDEGIALWFPAPNSYTGEDILELQGHGGAVVVDQILARVLEAGARLARPGEFTERAFLNGRIDLAQAEAVADLIDAASTQAARAALRSLQGEFSRRINDLITALTDLRVDVEAMLDFPDEELDFLASVVERLNNLQAQMANILSEARQGALLREGMTVVIAGRPNVGKSSLLNRLAHREVAIVTDIPGTTRDLVRETIHLEGMPLHLLDTAGLRDSDDPVEKEGIRRAYAALEGADCVLLVVDDTLGIATAEEEIYRRLPQGPTTLVVRNKADLSGREIGCVEGRWGDEIVLSATTGAGIGILIRHLKNIVGYSGCDDGNFSARRRHLEALRTAQQHLDLAIDQRTALELCAEELRLAQNSLGEITGAVISADNLLGKIFESFCIGK